MSKVCSVKKMKLILLKAEKEGYSTLNSSMCEKRLDWLEGHIGDIDNPSPLKRAYLLLFKKLEIDLDEVSIVFESGTKIIWHSTNWCDVLEACKELNLDTRKVCKEGFEDSVNQFVKRIDSRLKFSRNYVTLRPYGAFCEESIELSE